PREAVIGGVIRQGMGKIALGNFKIIEGDKVLVCATSNAIKKVERLFR
ncbi:MAG: Trk system potassium transporter TrkA, partial [Flavobacteriaceae bacterium]|nr:Trk system potassium transporter TrkA [Flavobacteriaceae bacterium]